MTPYSRLLLVPSSLLLSLALLYLLARSLPGDQGDIFFPSSLQEIRILASTLVKYQQQHTTYVLLLFCSAYLFKQTFAVPGSVFMNVLAGAIFGFPLGFLLCCLLTALGASCCYLLARGVGEELVVNYFPHKITQFRQKLDENRDELPFFLLFLRLFPMSPNWALNMVSGVLGVPIHLFFLSVLFGLMPYNYLCVTSGVLLAEVRDLTDILSWGNMARSATAALAALLPSLLLRWRGRKSKSGEEVQGENLSEGLGENLSEVQGANLSEVQGEILSEVQRENLSKVQGENLSEQGLEKEKES